MPYILAIDQGTTKTQSLIVNEKGEVIACEQYNFPQHFPKAGFVEHLNADIKNSVKITVETCIKKAGISSNKIDCIGITNQRETTCLFDKDNISPLPFIVWQCRRSQKQSDQLINHQKEIQKITGLRADPYFSGTKLMWIFANYPHILSQAKKKEILFGTIDSFLAHWLSGSSLHITDASNASRTLLMDLSTCSYSDEMLELLNIPKSMLPNIVKNIGPYGYTKGLDFLPDGIPIAALVGDQQSALFAQHCFYEGQTKLTLGTGAFILQNIGSEILFKNGLLTSIAYWIDEKPKYCLEGAALAAGAAVQFLIDNLEFGENFQDIENLLRDIKDSQGVSFVPSISGMGSPYWHPNMQGALLGLSRASTKAQISYSVLESIVLQNADIFLCMENTGKHLLIDGGLSQSDMIMQMHADILGVPCLRQDGAQKTALGAAYLAGLAMGIFSSFERIPKITSQGRVFNPNIDDSKRNEKIMRYRRAVKAIESL